MATLFWALFGLPDMNIVNLSSQANIPHTFTQTVGNFLYATYHVISIVVLLNVLIAMMSNTYTRVEVSNAEIIDIVIVVMRSEGMSSDQI